MGLAYLRSLTVRCDTCKRRLATVELFDAGIAYSPSLAGNVSLGKFCRACGRQKLKEVNGQGHA